MCDSLPYVFAQAIDPASVADAAKNGPVYLLSLVLAALVGYLFWKEKANREDAKEHRTAYTTSMDRTVDKVTQAMDRSTAAVADLGHRVTKVEERIGDFEDSIGRLPMFSK